VLQTIVPRPCNKNEGCYNPHPSSKNGENCCELCKKARLSHRRLTCASPPQDRKFQQSQCHTDRHPGFARDVHRTWRQPRPPTHCRGSKNSQIPWCPCRELSRAGRACLGHTSAHAFPNLQGTGSLSARGRDRSNWDTWNSALFATRSSPHPQCHKDQADRSHL
jgi:hypothetical protein